MKAYIHNPDIYRRHYLQQVGSALSGFHGVRMHRHEGDGIGAFLGKLARKAIPLLISGVKSGAKFIAPHAKAALKNMAKDVTGKVAQEITTRMTNTHKRKKSNPSRVRRRKKVKRTTSPDIFD